MAKLFIKAVILISVCCTVLVKGFDKKAFVGNFLAKMLTCKEEVEANESDISELFSSQPASTMEGKCLRACLMKKYEVMDANGNLDKTAMLELAAQFFEISEENMEIANEIIDKCNETEVSDDHCEAAEEYEECLKEEAEAHNMKDKLDF